MSYQEIVGGDDWFGADDIIGSDLYLSGSDVAFGADPDMQALMMGAAQNPMSAMQLAPSPANAQFDALRKQAFMQQLASRNSVAVVNRQPQKAREFPLGFPATIIAPGSTAVISQRPQIPFRGRRLFIPSDIAGAVVLNDIRVGKNSQLVASGPIPGRAFSEVGVNAELHLDTAQVSQDIVLNVTNISGAQITFYAALFGKGIE